MIPIYEAYNWHFRVNYNKTEGKRLVFQFGATVRPKEELDTLSGVLDEDALYDLCQTNQDLVGDFFNTTPLNVVKRRYHELHIPDLFALRDFVIFEDTIFLDPREDDALIHRTVEELENWFESNLEPLRPSTNVKGS